MPRYEIEVTLTSVHTFAIESESPSMASVNAMTKIADREPAHTHFHVKVHRGVK